MNRSSVQCDRRAFVAGAMASVLVPFRAQAAYPSRTVQIVVPFAAGGVNDVLAREIAHKLQEQMGKTIMVENRPGAGGNIGSEYVTKAEPDGHTLLMAANTLTMNPSLYTSLRFDPRRDLTPIARLASQSMIVVVRPDFPAGDLREFIALAKANPGKFTFGTPGPGTPQHFGTELLCAEAGIKMVHVPYKGAVPVMTDLMGGQIDLYLATETSAGGYIAGGRMKPLAVTGERRIPSYPDLKTVVEYGLPKSVTGIWYGVLGPAKMPPEIVTRINDELHVMAKSPDYRQRLQTMGLEDATSTPDEFRALIESEIPFWKQLAASTGIAAVD